MGASQMSAAAASSITIRVVAARVGFKAAVKPRGTINGQLVVIIADGYPRAKPGKQLDRRAQPGRTP